MTRSKQVLGITGGIGAGKSTILTYLQQTQDALVLECDAIAKTLQEPQQACYDAMRALLGDAMLTEDGSFDRRKLAKALFAEPALLQQVNDIVHPAVKQAVLGEITREKARQKIPGAQQETHRLIVVEAALLIDNHYETICDEIWYVYADENARRARLRQSRGYDDAKMDQIFAVQHTDAFFREHCQYTIDNSSEEMQSAYDQIDEGLKTHGFLYHSQRQLG